MYRLQAAAGSSALVMGPAVTGHPARVQVSRPCRRRVPALHSRHSPLKRAQMIVWIWDASGPAADACGVAGTAEAARDAAGPLLASGRADAARVEQAVIVLGSAALTYGYCPTGRAWEARLSAGRLTW